MVLSVEISMNVLQTTEDVTRTRSVSTTMGLLGNFFSKIFFNRFTSVCYHGFYSDVRLIHPHTSVILSLSLPTFCIIHFGLYITPKEEIEKVKSSERPPTSPIYRFLCMLKNVAVAILVESIWIFIYLFSSKILL